MLKKILVIHTAFIGDVILITPLLRGLKRVFPGSYIDVLVIPNTNKILENNPNINEVLVFDKKNKKIFSFFETVAKIKIKKYDLCFLPHHSMTSVLLTVFGKIPERIGFDHKLSALFLTKKIPFRKNILRIEKNLDLLKLFSLEKFDIQTELFPNNEMRQKAKNHLKTLKYNNNKIISIAPGAVWHTKRWPENYFKKLSTKLVDSHFGLVFIGSLNEKTLCDRVSPKKNSINLAGKTSIIEAAAVVENCDLMISNDSGALHLANAVKTDLITFFGPTDKRLGYFPFRPNDKVLKIKLKCSPCGKHGHKKCPLKHFKCMKDIKPEYVFDIVRQELS